MRSRRAINRGAREGEGLQERERTAGVELSDRQLHLKVEPVLWNVLLPGVFPVCPITNITYTYDAAGQLTQKCGTGCQPVMFSYDSARNMTRCTGANGPGNIYAYDYLRLSKWTETTHAEA